MKPLSNLSWTTASLLIELPASSHVPSSPSLMLFLVTTQWNLKQLTRNIKSFMNCFLYTFYLFLLFTMNWVKLPKLHVAHCCLSFIKVQLNHCSLDAFLTLLNWASFTCSMLSEQSEFNLYHRNILLCLIASLLLPVWEKEQPTALYP